MPASRTSDLKAACQCGRVQIVALGKPMMCVACYCDDCQEAARHIESSHNGAAVRDSDGGTGYVVYRKDRVRCAAGSELLKGFKLRDTSPTNRVIASCCNSPMLLDFDDGKHWVDVYRNRVEGTPPPIELRVCTRFRQAGGELPSDVPSFPGYPLRFIAKLIGAKVAMLFS
jgi:hypothetical protein